MKRYIKYVLSGVLLLTISAVNAQDRTLETLQQKLDSESTYFDIITASHEIWGEKPDRKGFTDKEEKDYKKFLRWRTFWDSRIDENGGFAGPEKARAAYLKEIRKNPNMEKAGETWSPIGPYGIDVDYANPYPNDPSTGISMNYVTGGIGAIHSVAYDPTDDQTMYAGSLAGGVFKTTNGGDYWWNITDNYPNMYFGVKDIIVDPNDPQTIYVSASGNNYGGYAMGHSGQTMGVLKSSDGGATWMNLCDINAGLSTAPFTLNYESDPSNGLLGRFISEMKLDPTSNTLYMLVTEEMNGGYTGATVIKTLLYRSQGGSNNWDLLHTFMGENLGELETWINSPNQLFISGPGAFYNFDAGTMVLSNLFSGLSAATGAGATTPVMIETTGDDPNTVYIYTYSPSKVLKFSVLPQTYSTAVTVPNVSNYGGQLQIRIPDHDKDRIYIGKTYHYRSIDNGASFQSNMSNSQGGNLHTDFNDIDFFPNSDKMIYGNDGGLIYREEAAATNEYLNGCGMLIAKAYSLWIDEKYENSFLIGLQDGNSAYVDGNGVWDTKGSGDGGMSMLSPLEGITYASNGTLYGHTPTGNNSTPLPGLNEQRRFHPNFPEEEMAYTWGGLHINKDVGGWTDYSPTFTMMVFNTVRELLLLSFDICESNPDVTYAYGTSWWGEHHKMFRGQAGQSTNPADWPEVNMPPLTGPINKITRVLAHPLDPNQVWVTLGGFYASDKVFWSGDGGQTWLNETAGIPNFPVSSIVMDKNSGNLFIGTDAGVYWKNSTYHATPWQKYGAGLPPSLIGEVRVNHNYNKIVASNFGRGIWEIPLSCPSGLTWLPPAFKHYYKDGEVYSTQQQDNNETTVIRATTRIKFLPGFKSTPTGNNSLSAKILYCSANGDPDPCSGYKSYIEAASNKEEGIEEFRAQISVYPNPNNGQFTIDFDGMEDNVEVSVINAVGSVIFSKTAKTKGLIDLNIQDQPSGIYFVKIVSGNLVKVERVIKQ